MKNGLSEHTFDGQYLIPVAIGIIIPACTYRLYLAVGRNLKGIDTAAR